MRYFLVLENFMMCLNFLKDYFKEDEFFHHIASYVSQNNNIINLSTKYYVILFLIFKYLLG